MAASADTEKRAFSTDESAGVSSRSLVTVCAYNCSHQGDFAGEVMALGTGRECKKKRAAANKRSAPVYSETGSPDDSVITGSPERASAEMRPRSRLLPAR